MEKRIPKHTQFRRLPVEPDHKKRWFLSTAAYLAKVDARLAGENRRDEEGRRIDSDGKKVFKAMP